MKIMTVIGPLAREYGLKHATQLRDWVKKYKNGELIEKDLDKRGTCTFLKKTFKNREMDLYNNAIICASMSQHNDWGLVVKGLEKVPYQAEKILFHSD